MDEEPQPKPPIVDYAPPAGRSVGWTVLGALGGVGGYLGLAVGALFLSQGLNVNSGWAVFALATIPPLVVMVALSYLLKSRAMLISSLITCATVMLSCGTCWALMSGMSFH